MTTPLQNRNRNPNPNPNQPRRIQSPTPPPACCSTHLSLLLLLLLLMITIYLPRVARGWSPAPSFAPPLLMEPQRISRRQRETFIIIGATFRRQAIVALQQRKMTQLNAGGGGGTADRNGDDDDYNARNNNNRGGGDDDHLSRFLDPQYQESENLLRAREYLSDNTVPISATSDEMDDDDEGIDDENDDELEDDLTSSVTNDSDSTIPRQVIRTDSLTTRTLPTATSLNNNSNITNTMTKAASMQAGTGVGVGVGALDNTSTNSPSSDSSSSSSSSSSSNTLEKNPYMAVISRLSPSEMIRRFTSTSHPRVQNAVRQTILGMLGGLPKLAFETTTFTTAQRLASLMFQLQMTGYMFKNAEYLLALQQSLDQSSSSSTGHAIGSSRSSSPAASSSSSLISQSSPSFVVSSRRSSLRDRESSNGSSEEEADWLDPRTTRIRGKIRIPLADPESTTRTSSSLADNAPAPNDSHNSSRALEVDAAAYMGELRQEIVQLRKELDTTRQAKEEALRKDLLLYIRTLPEQELRGLTNTMSNDVLVAMKGLVNAVLAGIGDEAQEPLTPLTITEQSGEAMAQLCMWQLAIGYNLRTLEVREEIKKSIAVTPDEENLSSSSSSFDGSMGVFE